MTLNSITLSKPKDWQQFERSMRVLMVAQLKDRNTANNGREGQPQAGVDVYGYRDGDARRLVGVQCKKRLEESVSLAELKAELEKAKTFKPALSEFILATTAPRDVKLQQAARELTLQLADDPHPIIVHVWGWNDIEERASEDVDAFSAFDPTANVFAKSAHLEIRQDLAENKELMGKVLLAIEKNRYPQIETTNKDRDTPRHGKIDAYAGLINSNDVLPGKAGLLRLKATEWGEASPSERYRIEAALAAAQVKLGKYDEAAKHLEAAVECDPENKSARLNAAKAWAFRNEHEKALAVAEQLLCEDPSNDEAASLFMHVREAARPVGNPLEGIPEVTVSRPMVLAAYITILRERADTTWWSVAKEALKTHPTDVWLKRFAYEAVLDQALTTNKAVVSGGKAPDGLWKELVEAAEGLKELSLANIAKGISLTEALALNTTTALRMLDREAEAKPIIDYALKMDPEDEDLKVTRAMLALFEKDFKTIVEVYGEQPSTPAGRHFVSMALKDEPEKALGLLDGLGPKDLPPDVWQGVVATKSELLLQLGMTEEAKEFVSNEVAAFETSVGIRLAEIRLLRRAGDIEEAKKKLGLAVELYGVEADEHPLFRFELANEANKLEMYGISIDLLEGHVGTDHISSTTSLYLVAAVHGRYLARASQFLNSLSGELQGSKEVMRARAVIALNASDPDAVEVIDKYLRSVPDDLDLILAKAEILAAQGKNDLLAALSEEALKLSKGASPAYRMGIAVLAARFGDAAKGIDLGYRTLIANWDREDVHLRYHGMILMNPNTNSLDRTPKVIAADAVIRLSDGGKERVYRIEDGSLVGAFAEERISATSEIARKLIGKEVGDEVDLTSHIGGPKLKVTEIKRPWLDALHRSLNEFNTRFPSAKGMQQFRLDFDADDPLAEMKKIVQAQDEAQKKAFEAYESNPHSLAMLASSLGKDVLDTWEFFRLSKKTYRVAVGRHDERQQAFDVLRNNSRAGAVVDVVTLAQIHHYGIEKPIRAVCGDLFTVQPVMEYLHKRVEDAKLAKGQKQGSMGWDGSQVVFTEYKPEDWDEERRKREALLEWARASIKTLKALPVADFGDNAQSFLDMTTQLVSAPIVACQGGQKMYLTDDIGLRAVAALAFGSSTVWLQPALMIATDEAHMSLGDYSDAVCRMALDGSAYITLNSFTLAHWARKGGWNITPDITQLVDVLTGPQADLTANTNVAIELLDTMSHEGVAPEKIEAMLIEFASSFAKFREGQRKVIAARLIVSLRRDRERLAVRLRQWRDEA